MESNATQLSALLAGLHDWSVLAVDDQPGQPIRVHVEHRVDRPCCEACGAAAWVKDRPGDEGQPNG